MNRNQKTMRTRRRFLRRAGLCACGLALAGMLGLTVPAFAAEGDVAVGGEHILTVRFPAGGLSVKQRADAITERLVTILSAPNLKPSDIVVVPMGRQAAKITVNNKLLVTVDAQTAHFNQMTPLQLAQSWAVHLRRVLPHINAEPNPNMQHSKPDSAPNSGSGQ